MSNEDPRAGWETTRALPALLAAIVGAVLMVWGFLAGIDAALNGNSGGNIAFQVMFFVGAALTTAALIMSLYRLVRGGSKTLSWVTIVIALLPMLGAAVLFIRATLAV